MKKKVVFMGTPIFAAEILETLVQLEYIEVVGVVSQPDKKVGRKQILTPTPVKEVALNHQIEVFQPLKIKDDFETVLEWKPDLVITCAYGQFVPASILYAFEYPCLNIHASLLPKFRGGAPIHKAIIQGEKETGITLMQMIDKMDAGVMYAQKKINIDIEDTTASLHDKLIVAGCELLEEKLEAFLNHQLNGVIQEEHLVTIARNISKEEEVIDCNKEVLEVYNHIRGLISWPVGYITLNHKKIKLWQVKLSNIDSDVPVGSLYSYNKALYLKCLNGSIEVLMLQPEGKMKCLAKDYINGSKDLIIK